jgi:hypothetical protein
MSKKKLSDEDFCRAAKRLGCSVAAIKAVAEVESRGDGFDSQDRPKILFERHKFAKYTNGKYIKTNPGICNWTAGGYGTEAAQYGRFSEAFMLDPNAAMLSASWGKFQVMGFNFAICGFKSVGEFVDAMKESEGRHLDAFVEYVRHNSLADELQGLNWAAFAKGYNGADYKKNNYDRKMADAYAKHKKVKIDCDNFDLAEDIVVGLGSNGAQVKEVQTKLVEQKLMAKSEVDGDFGERTKQAVRAFQCLNGLTVNGTVDAKTRKILFGE